MTPRSRSNSPAGSESSDSGPAAYVETSPRKRRRLSDDLSEHSEPAKPQPTLQTASRIKPRRKSVGTQSSVHLEETEISNGKVVDAKSSFATLGVTPKLIASLSKLEIHRPTAIQKGCIPEILSGKDVIGGSTTGSGKTVAFVVPTIQRWAEDETGIFAVVLTPTR